MIGLWLALAGAFLGLVVFESPNLPNTPFAGVSIDAGNQRVVHLPNRAFACIETDQQFQCATEIDSQPLKLTWTKGKTYAYDLSNCRATYAEQAVTCQDAGFTYARGLMSLYTLKGLGLSPQQLRSLQQNYWGINGLMQLGELHLMRITTGLAIAAGISAACFTWLHPGRLTKAFASLVCGLGIYHLVEQLLGRVPYDWVTPSGLTIERWNLLVTGGAIAVAIGVSGATAGLLWRGFGRWFNLPVSLSTSAGIFHLCWFPLSMSYLSLGGFGINDQTLLLQLSALISIVPAIAALVLLWRHTDGAIQAFVCLSSGFGAFALTTFSLFFSLLGLGYLD